MQVSSPIQAASSLPENVHPPGGIEGLFGNANALWGCAAQKKNKPGIFAKLLEGLAVRGKKTAIDPANNKAAEGDSAPETKKNTQVRTLDSSVRKKTSGAAEQGIPENIPGTFFAVLKQDLPVEQALPQVGAGELRIVRKLKEFSHSGGNSTQDQNRLSEEAHGPVVVKQEKPDVLGDPPVRADKAASEKRGIPVGAKNLKTTELPAASVKETENLAKPVNYSGVEKDLFRLPESRLKKSREKIIAEVRSGHTETAGREAGAVETSSGSAFGARPPITEIELPVNLFLSEREAEPAVVKDGKDPSFGRNFEDALARELRGNLSAEIVRDATIIVRNGGEGTIRLSLRPASLGDVKIRLEMTENKITGRIVVESGEALRAFERELPVLEKAFRDSGFSETNLEMFLASENSAGNGNFSGREQGREGDLLAQVQAASSYDAEMERPSRLEELPLPGEMLFPSTPGITPVNLLI
jgi:hypothetical protein